MQSTRLRRQRHVLLMNLERKLEGPMVFLGFVWLALLIIEMIWGLSPLLKKASIAIWIIFILDFFLKFFLATQKLHYLKQNWLTGLSLLLPALRIVRIFRVLHFLRTAQLVKVIASINRSMKSFSATMKRRGFKYVVAITLAVILGGAAGMLSFEKGPGIKSYPDALYWTTMIITSIGSEYWPQTPEGKTLCLLLSVYGFCVFGYITATLASFFVDRDAERSDAPLANAKDIAQLRQEIRLLRQDLGLKQQEAIQQRAHLKPNNRSDEKTGKKRSEDGENTPAA